MLLGVTYNTNNYGVRVLLSGTVSALAARHPELSFYALDYQHRPAIWHEDTPVGTRMVRLVNLRFSWKLFLPNNIFTLLLLTGLSRLIPWSGVRYRLLALNPTLRHILGVKVCLSLSGGDSFSDIYGGVRLIYVSAPQLLALWLGIPLIQLPQTFGPFESRTARMLARYILRRSASLYSRDAPGRSLVQSLLDADATVVAVSPDFGFFMNPKALGEQHVNQIEAWKKGRTLVGINTSKLLYQGGYSGRNMFGLRDDYVDLTHQLIRDLLAKPGIFVLLIPHVFGEVGEAELPLCRELQSKYLPQYPNSIGFLDSTFDHREIKSVIGLCDLFIGARMHACIAAVSQCVPTVALAYSDKFRGVMDVVASPAVEVIDLRVSGLPEIATAVTRLHDRRHDFRQDLVRRMPSVREHILETAHTVLAESRPSI